MNKPVKTCSRKDLSRSLAYDWAHDRYIVLLARLPVRIAAQLCLCIVHYLQCSISCLLETFIFTPMHCILHSK